jgi:DNA-directed RNA polymerase-3 subunit RPC5
LHFTKLTGIVKMRNQFTYLDAVTQLEAQARKREKEAQEGAKPAEARTVLVQHKRTNEAPSVEKARQYLQSTFEEKWTKVRYIDAEDPDAFNLYDETLFIHDTPSVPQLHSSMNPDQYLEAVSAPSRDRMGRKKAVTKQYVELSDTSDEEPDREEVRENNGIGAGVASEVIAVEDSPGNGTGANVPAGEEMDVEPKVRTRFTS